MMSGYSHGTRCFGARSNRRHTRCDNLHSQQCLACPNPTPFRHCLYALNPQPSASASGHSSYVCNSSPPLCINMQYIHWPYNRSMTLIIASYDSCDAFNHPAMHSFPLGSCWAPWAPWAPYASLCSPACSPCSVWTPWPLWPLQWSQKTLSVLLQSTAASSSPLARSK